jgi:hypothetical protein
MIFNKKKLHNPLSPHPSFKSKRSQKITNMKIKKVKKYNPSPFPPSTIKALKNKTLTQPIFQHFFSKAKKSTLFPPLLRSF